MVSIYNGYFCQETRPPKPPTADSIFRPGEY